MVVFAVALIVLGPEKLPEAAQRVGRLLAEARQLSARFSAEVQQAMSFGAPETSGYAASSPPAPTSTTPGPASDGSASQPPTLEEHL